MTTRVRIEILNDEWPPERKIECTFEIPDDAWDFRPETIGRVIEAFSPPLRKIRDTRGTV